MDIYFNELSLNSTYTFNVEDASALKELYNCLHNYGINKCRLSQKYYADIIERVSAYKGNVRDLSNFLYAFFASPYETEEVIAVQEELLNNPWSFNEAECFGFAIAYLLDSICFSIDCRNWDVPSYSILKNDKAVNVRSFSDVHTLSFHEPWLLSLKSVELVPCLALPQDKSISLRDDHGKDVLMDFSKRLVNCEYVIEVLQSNPFKPHARRFIDGINRDGVIDIVLPWTDQGYGMAIKTTGRDLRETKAIADIILNKYGHK